MSKIRCICCNQEATSTHRHHFAKLQNCRNGSYADGGNDYIRIGGRDLRLIETWNEPESKWNESRNQIMKDLVEGKYSFPAYSQDKGFDFSNYCRIKDHAEKALKEALFSRYGIKPRMDKQANAQADSLWYMVWNMPLNSGRDPNPLDVYFNFIHFVDLIRDRIIYRDKGSDRRTMDVPVYCTIDFHKDVSPEAAMNDIRSAIHDLSKDVDKFLKEDVYLVRVETKGES